LLRSSDI